MSLFVLSYPISKLDDRHHVIAAINIDFSFGFKPFSIARTLNSIFFDDKPVFFEERNHGHGQMSLFNLMDSSVCTCFGQRPVEIWNFRGNALMNMNSKQIQMIRSSATSLIVFINENCKQNNKYWDHTIGILDLMANLIG